MDTRASKSAKKAVNLSIDADLLERARGLGLNLSQEFETRLSEVVRAAEQTRWLAENQDAIEDYNRHVAKHGLFSDGKRLF